MSYAIRLLVIVIWCAVCVHQTGRRVAIFSDERVLWTDAVQKAPTKPRPWVNLGVQYAREGHDGLAEYAFREAIAAAANPDRPTEEQYLGRILGAANLATLRLNAGDIDGAAAILATADEPQNRSWVTSSGVLKWLRTEADKRSSSH